MSIYKGSLYGQYFEPHKPEPADGRRFRRVMTRQIARQMWKAMMQQLRSQRQ